MKGMDQVGPSCFDGIIVYRADGLAFKLSKVYDDRKKAEQIGDF